MEFFHDFSMTIQPNVVLVEWWEIILCSLPPRVVTDQTIVNFLPAVWATLAASWMSSDRTRNAIASNVLDSSKFLLV